MKNLIYATIVFLLCSCSKSSNNEANHVKPKRDGSSPATVEDAIELAKKYDLDFKPDKNFNPTKKITRDSLEVLFISLQTPAEVKANNKQTAQFIEEYKKAKTPEEREKIENKYPRIKKQMRANN